jgi:hypothetical protein
LLEAHALALQADIAEMHRTLNAFDHAQDASIGSLLRQCIAPHCASAMVQADFATVN